MIVTELKEEPFDLRLVFKPKGIMKILLNLPYTHRVFSAIFPTVPNGILLQTCLDYPSVLIPHAHGTN